MQLDSFSLAYEESVQKRLIIGVGLGDGPGGTTAILLSTCKWRWEKPEDGPIEGINQRRLIVDRVKEAIKALGYHVDSYMLEVLSGLAQHELCVKPLGAGKIQCSLGQRSLAFTLDRIDSSHVAVQLGNICRWNAPHDKDAIAVNDLHRIITDLAALVGQQGFTLVVKK